jgi:hypothetical protein
VTAVSHCPDALLVQARAGTLSFEDRARLDAHLGRCDACRVMLDVGKAFDASLGARTGDDEIARRIADRLVVPPRRRRSALLFAAALVLVSGSVAAANAPAVWRAVVEVVDWVSPVPDPVVTAPPPEAKLAPRKAVVPIAPVERETAPVEPSATVALAPTTVSAPPPSAAELFAQGNASRREGKEGEARRAYQRLQRLFPGSVEAVVSHVSLGRLERGKNPGTALRHFNAYLAQSSHRTLAEEALFGKASCLAALGRTLDERAAWGELLQRFPSSVYAARARARLSDPDAD